MSGFCTECGHHIAQFEGLDCCPKCGTRSLPCDDANQVRVAINWHELRVLTMWAEHYARLHDLQRTVFAVARRLEDQHPDRALVAPLTLAGELRHLNQQPGVQVHVFGDNALAQDVESIRNINELD